MLSGNTGGTSLQERDDGTKLLRTDAKDRQVALSAKKQKQLRELANYWQ